MFGVSNVVYLHSALFHIQTNTAFRDIWGPLLFLLFVGETEVNPCVSNSITPYYWHFVLIMHTIHIVCLYITVSNISKALFEITLTLKLQFQTWLTSRDMTVRFGIGLWFSSLLKINHIAYCALYCKLSSLHKCYMSKSHSTCLLNLSDQSIKLLCRTLETLWSHKCFKSASFWPHKQVYESLCFHTWSL